MKSLMQRIAPPLLMMVALAGCVGQAQRTTAADLNPIMLRRMAEAVEGHRTGAPVWVVIGSAAPHPVVGVRARREDADALRRATAVPAVVFGPFQSPRDPARVRQVLISCHRAGEGENEPTVCSRPVRLDSIRSIALVVRAPSGETRSFPVPEGVDATFLTVSGMRKYVLPYYSWVIGVDGAQRMWTDFNRDIATAEARLREALRPQLSPEEIARLFRIRVMTGCHHDGASMYDRRGICPQSLLPAGHQVIGVTIRTAKGDTVTTPLLPTTEVVTFSLSAADKFVIPHFVTTEGVDRAAARRREWMGQITAP